MENGADVNTATPEHNYTALGLVSRNEKNRRERKEIIELLDDINRDLNNYDLEFRIRELESKFSKDLSETTFNELKELKKKQNIN